MKSYESHTSEYRISIVCVIFLVFFVIIALKATYIQIFRYSGLSEVAARQYEKSVISKGKRGAIYDCKLRELAVSTDGVSIAAYPSRIKGIETTAPALSRCLGIDSVALQDRLIKEKSFIWVKRQASPREIKSVENLNLSGIDFILEPRRFYPNRTLAAQLIGFSGIDGKGLEGLEFSYDAYLKGHSGGFTVLKDAKGKSFEIDRVGYVSSHTYGGNNLILTIDATIQYISEKALEAAIAKTRAKKGMAIVMVPSTGAILAMANVPLFNPNSFEAYTSDRYRNGCVTDSFEPGSTMKIFSAAAALESGVDKKDSVYYCENGQFKVGDNLIRDTKPHGWLTLEEIIKFSSNIGALKVSEAIGPEYLHYTLSQFGFGKKTEIDYPGETNGMLSIYNRWSKIEAGTISFGYGISVSAIQLITALSAIANDGILMKPYVVRAIVDSNHQIIHQPHLEYEGKRVISKKSAAKLKQMLKSVVEEGGTGTRAAVEGYPVCGKTGTAKKIDKKGEYSAGRYLASFMGFVPAENPEIAIVVVIDEPQTEYYGGIVAAPVFRQIAHETLNYMNIPPAPKNQVVIGIPKKEING